VTLPRSLLGTKGLSAMKCIKKKAETHIPISWAKAERSSIDGLEVRVKRSFRASSWYGSGRVRLVREEEPTPLR